MNHSFDINIAKKYGIEEAILLQYLYFWIEKNKANEKHFYNGTYWTYNTKKAFSNLFPYMTPRKIDYTLNNLIEKGLVITDNFNADGRDRTLWYALTNLGYCILQNCEMQNTKVENDNNNYNNTNTDINITDNKEKSIINNTKEMEIFEHWNKKNIIIHRDFNKLEKKIKEALKEHDLETIKSAIDHYSEVINNQDYFYKYKWTLEQFLSRGKGLVEFTDKGSKWLNYLDFKNKNKPKEISRETAYPEFDDVGYIR